MAVGDIYQVRVLTYGETQVAFNIRHYRVSAEVTGGATSAEIATALDAAFATLYKALLTAAANYRGVGVQRIRPLPASLESVTAASDGVGDVAGDPIPGQVAGLISLRTAFAGRAFRGRVYVPFCSEADNTATADPQASYVTRLDTLGSAFLATRIIVGAAGTTTLVPGIFHRSGGTTTDLVARISRTVWATQRRRGDFGARNILPF